MANSATEQVELELLTACIQRVSGYDFSQYSTGSLSRILGDQCKAFGVAHLSGLIPLLLHDRHKREQLLQQLTVDASGFYRYPDIFRDLVTQVFPVLESYPFINIWHAGCGAGQEVYSLAILLAEAGLLCRSRIYASDLNEAVLARAGEGCYSRRELTQAEAGYVAAGGQGELQDQFVATAGRYRIASHIRSAITFVHHNLATDAVFAQMQLVLCKNVLIYFQPGLREKTLSLFAASLCDGGLLCLGATECLVDAELARHFQPLANTKNIYQKTSTSLPQTAQRSLVSC